VQYKSLVCVRNLTSYFPQWGHGSFLGFLPRVAINHPHIVYLYDNHRRFVGLHHALLPFCDDTSLGSCGSVLPGVLHGISLPLRFSLHGIPGSLVTVSVCYYD
jgi:hypothetical protein